MTVIAFDGKVIASDSRRTIGTLVDVGHNGPKFSVVGTGKRKAIVASAGNSGWGTQVERWAAGKLRAYPRIDDEDPEKPSGEAFVYRNGLWLHYFSDTTHYEDAGSIWAIGSGKAHALTAFALGHDAVTAAWVASKLDSSCGGDIHYAPIDELLRVGNAAIRKTSHRPAVHL